MPDRGMKCGRNVGVHHLLEKKLIESRIDRKKILVTKCQKFFPKISITLKYSWNLHQIFFHPPKFSITKKNSWNLHPKLKKKFTKNFPDFFLHFFRLLFYWYYFFLAIATI